VDSFGSLKMGAADRQRANGYRTSTNNNSVQTAVETVCFGRFYYFWPSRITCCGNSRKISI